MRQQIEEIVRGLVARGRPFTNVQLWAALRSKGLDPEMDDVKPITFKLGCAYGVFSDGGAKHWIPPLQMRFYD